MQAMMLSNHSSSVAVSQRQTRSPSGASALRCDGSQRCIKRSSVLRSRTLVTAQAYPTATRDDGAAPAPAALPGAPLRVFCDWAVYKNKAAMCTKLILPTWKPVGTTGVELDRNGVLLLEFAQPLPSAGGGGYGSNQRRGYDWQQKINFALSATELGAILAGDGLEPRAEKPLSFVHDPGMGSPSAGQVYKTLKLQGNPDGTQMWSISQRTTGSSNANISVNVSRAEFAVFRTLVAYVVPHMLGWDRVIDEGHAGFQMVAGSGGEDTYNF